MALSRFRALTSLPRSYTQVRFSSSESNSSSGVAKPEESNRSLGQVRADHEVVVAGPVSGAPEELAVRPVRIYQPAPSTSQSAKATSHHWRLDWDILQGAGKWENRLMGWASSADYMQATHLKFKTKDAAIHFCEKQGWPFFVQEPQTRKFLSFLIRSGHVSTRIVTEAFVPKSYANNYLHSPDKLRYVHTK